MAQTYEYPHSYPHWSNFIPMDLHFGRRH